MRIMRFFEKFLSWGLDNDEFHTIYQQGWDDGLHYLSEMINDEISQTNERNISYEHLMQSIYLITHNVGDQ